MTLRDTALAVLLAVETKDAYSNIALRHELSRASLDERDAALATDIVYGTLQHRNQLDWHLTNASKRPLHTVDPQVLNLLRLSVYQLAFLDRVPPHAVVHEAVETAKRACPKAQGFINGVLRKLTSRVREETKRFRQMADECEQGLGSRSLEELSIALSHPEWLVEQWIRVYGLATTVRLCQANNARPPFTLRVNPLRTTMDHCIEELEQAGFEVEHGAARNSILLRGGRFDPNRQPLFQEGFVTVQDVSSMLAAQILDPQPDQRVFDACAAPGGKTTQMAEYMGDRGDIVACDLHDRKLSLIREACKRLGIRQVRTVSGDAGEIARREGPFDAILLDAPCSGYGVVRRRPEIKWKRTLTDVQSLANTQARLLTEVSRALRPGGALVYSTCTVMPQENSEVVSRFLQAYPGFRLESPSHAIGPKVAALIGDQPWLQLLPHHFASDGFFIAKLRRVE